MTRTLQAQAPWAILLLTAALVMAKLWLFARLVADVPPSERITELLFQLLPVSFAAVGTVIAARRPGHRIGWLLLGGSLAIAGAQLAWSYVILQRELRHPTAQLRGRRLGRELELDPVALAAFALLPLLFPDGQFPSTRWRPVAWAMVAWCAVIMAFLALYPALISAPDLDNPLDCRVRPGRRCGGCRRHRSIPWSPSRCSWPRQVRPLFASARPEPSSASS